MIVKRVGPMSFAKVSGTLYALLGLCFGAVLSLVAMVGAAVSRNSGATGFGAVLGVGAVIFLPILYGVFGFVFSLIGAALYNIVAGWVGGVEMDLQ